MTTDDKHDGNGHFKLRLDPLAKEIDDSPIPNQINEMRLDKITQRVTMISVMIPVLIVIVLVIAYLDIKKRVVQTEDSGAIEFRKLSADLESRFSSLSLRQAKLEETLASLAEKSDHSLAAIQVRMEKLQDEIAAARQNSLTTADLDTVKGNLQAVQRDLVKKIDDVSAAASQGTRQSAALLQELKAQVVQQGEAISAARDQIAALQKSVTQVETGKLDRQSLDLALRLETLKIETALKTQIADLKTRIDTLEKQLAQTRPQSPAPAHPPAPAPSPPGASTPITRDGIQETPIR